MTKDGYNKGVLDLLLFLYITCRQIFCKYQLKGRIRIDIGYSFFHTYHLSHLLENDRRTGSLYLDCKYMICRFSPSFFSGQKLPNPWPRSDTYFTRYLSIRYQYLLTYLTTVPIFESTPSQNYIASDFREIGFLKLFSILFRRTVLCC